VLVASWLAGKAGLPNPCCRENLEYLFEIVQVKVPGSVSYPPSWSSNQGFFKNENVVSVDWSSFHNRYSIVLSILIVKMSLMIFLTHHRTNIFSCLGQY
jgi:hypothetical protein